MPSATKEFSVNCRLNDVWEIFNNHVEVGKCIRGCEGVIVKSQDESEWNVKVSVGIVTRRIEAVARVMERIEPTKLVLKLDSKDGDFTARFDVGLGSASESSTKIKFEATIEASGPFQWVVNQIIKGQLDKMVTEFAQCLPARIALQSRR